MSAWMGWLTLVSVGTFIFSLATLPWMAAKIPADYFCHSRRQITALKNAHPAVRIIVISSKNLLGLLLLCSGIIMLFTPGQGLLTIAMGLLLMNYPGKYRLERHLVSYPSVLRAINWLRAKRRVPPLTLNPAGD